jgi:uncharacterized tellurite resistance protein B-like protein
MEQGGEKYLRSKYPGLPTEAVAEKLCELAEKHAAMAGGLSGAAASTSILSAGLALPAALVAVMGEVLYTVRLQLRLVHDLHLVYGVPLDPADPEDLLGIFATVYGIKAAEVGGLGVKAFGPEVARAQLQRLIQGNTKLIQNAVKAVLGPRIAKDVTKRALIKAAVPVAGILISAGWNYGSTRMMGSRVRFTVRLRAELRQETIRLKQAIVADSATQVAVLEAMLALACADGRFDDKERGVYLAFLSDIDLSSEELEYLESRVCADLESVCISLSRVTDADSRLAIAKCLCLIAAADGDVAEGELTVLARLLAALDQTSLLDSLPDLARRHRREAGSMEQALASVGAAAGHAGDKISAASGQAIGWMKTMLAKKVPADVREAEIEFVETKQERETAHFLSSMDALIRRLAAGEIDASEYRAQADELAAAFNDADRKMAPADAVV